MDVASVREFDIDLALVHRFNAWRQVTLGLIPIAEAPSSETYTPQPATIPLERAMSNQLTWLTAWRIGRYASGSLKTTPFYQRATDTHAQTSMRNAAREARDRKQADIEKLRAEQDARESDPRYPKQPKPAGVKDFDPDIAQTQLREAAEEFRLAYNDPNPLSSALGRRILPKLSRTVLLFAVPKNAQTEAVRMRTTGFEKYPELFPAPQRPKDSISAVQKGDVDESRNVDEPTGQLRALFDDQVHDSRAWFLYDYGREPRGSYFRERMVFFGDSRRKMLVQLVEQEVELIALAEQEQSSPFDPQRVAEAQKDVEAIWEDFYAKRKEATDESV